MDGYRLQRLWPSTCYYSVCPCSPFDIIIDHFYALPPFKHLTTLHTGARACGSPFCKRNAQRPQSIPHGQTMPHPRIRQKRTLRRRQAS